MTKLLAGSREMIERMAGAEVNLQLQVRHDSLYIYADPIQVEQVILNLAANARDAMPQGGQLTIETSGIRVDKPDSGERYMVPVGSYVLCSVRDTGSGMSAETLDHIFEPFFTTKDPGKGTGLGLSTVYGIVKQNDGFIFVESEPGSGSCFTMYFPLVSEEDLLRSEDPHAPAASLRGTERILLAEPEAKVRRYTKTVLQKYGYSVLTAATPGDALGLGKTAEVDLLISSTSLPEMSGIELAEKVQEMQPKLKVLLITDTTEPESSITAHAINKPFTSEALLRKIRKILG